MVRVGMRILLLSLLGSVCLWPRSTLAQTSTEQTSRAKIVSDLSAEASRAWVSRTSRELRDGEAKELPMQCAGYNNPHMARSLLDPQSFIAIVVVTTVAVPENGLLPGVVGLRVEQFLRGSSEQRELEVDNGASEIARVFCGGGFGGPSFYFAEPKVGDRYLVGYSFLGGDTSRAYISGGIDLADHEQAEEMIDVQRFLNIEAMDRTSDFAAFVTALNDQVPWFRDLAAQRLVQSKACNNSLNCRQAFLNATRNLLSSSKLADRIEGLNWTELLIRPMPGDRNEWGANGIAQSNGLSLMSTEAVRDLLRLAVSDPSLRVADEAYRQLELFDFFHSAPRSKCILIFPILRKSVLLLAAELKGVSYSGYLDCTPEEGAGSE